MKLRLAAPTLLVDLRKVPGLSGLERQNGGWRDRRDDAAHGARRARTTSASSAEAAGTIADQQVRNRGTIGGSLAHGDPASDLPGRPARLRGLGDGARPVRRARDRGRRPVPGLPHDGGRPTTRSSRAVNLPGARRLRATATRSSTAAARTGRWSPSARWSRRPATARARTCASGSPTWARCRCARPRSRRRCAASRSTPPQSRRPPSRPPRAPTRPATSTRRRTTSATWRGCCAGARARRRPAVVSRRRGLQLRHDP